MQVIKQTILKESRSTETKLVASWSIASLRNLFTLSHPKISFRSSSGEIEIA